ncbi:MAG: class I SAM-dependent methyltransferase [Halioglobus sp.]|nr:class I SAM-dependent methyltransferase [Halioglobus sp.]
MGEKIDSKKKLRCKICKVESIHETYVVREMMLGLDHEFEYFLCADCGCLQINNIPHDLSSYYPSNYYSFNAINWKNRFLKAALVSRNKAAVFGKGIIGRTLNVLKPPSVLSASFLSCVSKQKLDVSSRILDVGCGEGIFLQHLAEIGFTNLTGVDPFVEKEINTPNGVRILKSSFSDLDGVYDFIIFNHSFEHLADPAAAMSDVRRLLAADGLCMIRIPVVPCFAWERYRENWVQLDAPRHLYIHSKDSMSLLANGGGLYVEDMLYDSTSYQILGSERYEELGTVASNQNPSSSRLKTILKRWRATSLAKNLNRENRGDQAAFLLRQRSS